MVKIEAVIQPCQLEEIRDILDSLGVGLPIVSEVHDLAPHTSQLGFYRGSEYRVSPQRLKVELLASADRADEVVDELLRLLKPGLRDDDGSILVYPVCDAIRIRTGARLRYSLP